MIPSSLMYGYALPLIGHRAVYVDLLEAYRNPVRDQVKQLVTAGEEYTIVGWARTIPHNNGIVLGYIYGTKDGEVYLLDNKCLVTSWDEHGGTEPAKHQERLIAHSGEEIVRYVDANGKLYEDYSHDDWLELKRNIFPAK